MNVNFGVSESDGKGYIRFYDRVKEKNYVVPALLSDITASELLSQLIKGMSVDMGLLAILQLVDSLQGTIVVEDHTKANIIVKLPIKVTRVDQNK